MLPLDDGTAIGGDSASAFLRAARSPRRHQSAASDRPAMPAADGGFAGF